MARSKIAISLDEQVLKRLDQLVSRVVFRNRGQAIQVAVSEKLERLERSGLTRKCTKLDPEFEKSLAEERTHRGVIRVVEILRGKNC